MANIKFIITIISIFLFLEKKNDFDICYLLILVPMDVTALHLAENNLTRLSQSMFLGRSRLKQIFIRHSNIHDIENATFSGLDHLELIGKISNLFILHEIEKNFVIMLLTFLF